jgi:hypothetical protein
MMDRLVAVEQAKKSGTRVAPAVPPVAPLADSFYVVNGIAGACGDCDAFAASNDA